MLLRNTIEFTQMTLGLVSKILNSVDVFAVLHERFVVIDPLVFEL